MLRVVPKLSAFAIAFNLFSIAVGAASRCHDLHLTMTVKCAALFRRKNIASPKPKWNRA
jgi:hypothetical protein